LLSLAEARCLQRERIEQMERAIQRCPKGDCLPTFPLLLLSGGNCKPSVLANSGSNRDITQIESRSERCISVQCGMGIDRHSVGQVGDPSLCAALAASK